MIGMAQASCLKREMRQGLRHAGIDSLLLPGVKAGRVPEFEVRTHTHKDELSLNAGCLTQFRRNQNPPRSVHIDILGAAKKNPLPIACCDREGTDFFALELPGSACKQQKAAIGVPGEREPTFTLRKQDVPMP